MVIKMHEIEVRKNGVCICECQNERCLYPPEIMKDMKAAGFKFYQDGKLYKPDVSKKKSEE